MATEVRVHRRCTGMHSLLLALSLTSASTHVLGSTPRAQCGNDDPGIQAYFDSLPSAVQAQAYHSEEQLLQLGLGRFLQSSQSYLNTAPFVPISALNAQGGTAPLRIGIVWDVINNNDTVAGKQRQCAYAGQSIWVRGSNNADVQTGSGFCTASHIVAAGTARGNVLRLRTNTAAAFWTQTLKVRPVRDASITIAPNVVTAFGLTTTTVPAADLVMIMTARPSPNSPIAGFAVCVQRDQYNRCTVGQFNWVPEQLNVASSTAPDVIGSEMHTALHEIVHLLGGMNPGHTNADSPFLNAAGVPMNPAGNVYVVEQDANYGNKAVSKIVTPRVLNLTRTAFACPTATGFPLEDMPLGVGSHWEARLAGPEFMSYGSGQGQVYVSDLTLAYLEDTNQYIANYSYTGQIAPASADDFKDVSQQGTLDSSYVPPKPLSKGFPTWGRYQGCSFLTSNARNWPAGYTCSTNQQYGCTADHRMAAVCVIKGDYASEPACASYGDVSTYSSGAYSCSVANDANGGVTSAMQFFQTNAAAATASGVSTATTKSTGGYSAASDYVPVYVGYWDCTLAKPSDNSSGALGGEGGGLGAFSSLFGSSQDMSNFGGQARCPQCRCFDSSLLELSKSINPAFPVYGLCYRANCYRSDYLQIAIKGQLSSTTVYWYACPAAGGKLYIPGFTGSFHCPVATTFCAMETVTGIKYSEQNLLLSAIFWGIVVGGAFILMVICTFPCCRDALIRCSKRACGATSFKVLDQLEGSDIAKVAERARVTGLVESWILVCVNTLALIIGLTMAGLVAYAIYSAIIYELAIPLLGMACLIIFVSAIGVVGARAKAEEGPSCWLLTYFFTDLLLMVFLLYSIAYNLSYTNWSAYVDENWDEISNLLPASSRQGATREAQIASATQTIQNNFAVLTGLAITVLIVYLVSLFCAARLIKFRTLISMTLAVLNNAFMVFGLIMSVVGFYLLAGRGRAAGIMLVIGLVISVGLFSIVTGAVGTFGTVRKSIGTMMLYVLLQVLATGLLCYGVYLFISQGQSLQSFIASQDDAQLARIASDLGLSLTKTQISQALQGYLTQLAIACAVMIAFTIILAISGVFFMRAVHRERIVMQNKNLRHVNEEDTAGQVPPRAHQGIV